MGNPSPTAHASETRSSPSYDVALCCYPSEDLWERVWEFHGKFAPGQAQYLKCVVLVPTPAMAPVHPAVVARLASKFRDVTVVSSSPIELGEVPANVKLTESFENWTTVSDTLGRRTVDMVIVPEGWERISEPLLLEKDTNPTRGYEDETVFLREIRRMMKPAPCGTLVTYSHPFPLFHNDQPLSDLLLELYARIWYRDGKPEARIKAEALWDGMEVSSAAWKTGVEERWVFPLEHRTPFFRPESFTLVELQQYIRTRPEYIASDALKRAEAEKEIGRAHV